MSRQTRTQRFAAAALPLVKHAAQSNADYKQEYRARAMSFPAMVMQSGLCQALGFLAAKAGAQEGNAYGRFLADIAKVIGKPDGPALQQAAIATPDLNEYRRLTRDVLEAAGWIKRFSQTLIDVGSDDPRRGERS